jgi:1-phosphofructokinase
MKASPHLFTLTGNLLAERTFEFEAWAPGHTQRALRDAFQVGGKGINVSKMLNRLGTPNTALCFTGGAPGAECEAWLAERGFRFTAFPTDRPTRSGTVIRGGRLPETTFLGRDVIPGEDPLRACAEFLAAQPDGQVLAICGSFPGWETTAAGPLREVVSRWIGRGIVAVDSYGPVLDWLLARPVDLVKINATELNASRTPAAAHLDGAPRRWVITNGPAPVRLREPPGPEVSLVPPHVDQVSPTGSGDVLFACILHALYRGGASLRDAVTFALPFAAANAAHPGIAEFPDPRPALW